MCTCIQLTEDGTERGDGREGDEILAELEKKQAELTSIVSLTTILQSHTYLDDP